MYGFVITTAGEAMLARAAAGEALVLDAVMVGRGVVESVAAAKALNALIDPVAAATSTAPAVSGNQISMTVEYRNDLNGGLEAGFALSEFGISAHVGDDPAALLYYGSLGDAPQPVKPASEGLDVHRFPVAIAVTGEVSVTLEYPAGGFLTEEDLGGLNYIPTSEKGKPDGVATLGGDGKVPEEQLPEMDYDPAGSAEKVQDNLDTHIANKENPHGVKADQVPYDNSRGELQSKNVQGAIDELYARMYGDMKVRIQVYETGTTTPISGVLVTGVASETGGPCYADDSGVAIGYVLSDSQTATATVKVDDRYIDLAEQTEQTVSVKKGETSNATIYATRVSNPSGKIETFTSSTQKMFTNKANRVDVHCVGAGAGGSSGAVTTSSKLANGGRGGGQGTSSYRNSVAFTPNKPFQITIGEKGTGGKGSSGSTNISSKSGTSGGTTSCLGVVAVGGSPDSTSNGSARINYDGIDGRPGGTNSELLFGEDSSTKFGGSGGGGGAYALESGVSSTSASAGRGGSPFGGDGAEPAISSGVDGGNASGIGGGGGGGSASIIKENNYKCYAGDGGDGGPGAAYVRWFYA